MKYNTLARVVRLATTVLGVCGALVSFNASANILTNGDFEAGTSVDLFWASTTDLWGAENASITGTTGGVTTFGSQMLQVNHAGGGSVSQVHQIVSGPFTIGSMVSFDVDLNSNGAGLLAQLYIEGRSTINSGITGLLLSSAFALDSDASTWQNLAMSFELTDDYNMLAAEIRFVHNGALSANPGFADNAVLTVTPPAPVPAPATIVLFALGLFGLAARRRAV